MKTFLAILLAAAMGVSAGYSQNINGNAKAVFQTSQTAVLGPFTSSTTGNGAITTPWTNVLEVSLKTASQWDLVITPSFECGLQTSTTISSKNMVQDLTTASATIKVRVLVDGVPAAPGEVVFSKRTATLSAVLEGAIAGCLTIVTNASGALTVVLDPTCVTAEQIGLLEDTMTACSFTFAVPNEPTGVHLIQVQAQIATWGSSMNGTFSATALMGKGTVDVSSSRLVKVGTASPYVLGQ